jgi:uncharacterized protein (DUF2147 family)
LLVANASETWKTTNLKNNTNNQTLCRFRTTLHTNNNQRQKQNRNKGNNKQNKTKQTKSRACDLGFGVYPMRRRSSSSSSNDAAKVGIRKLRTHGLVFWSCVLVICLLVFEGRKERRVRNWRVDWGGRTVFLFLCGNIGYIPYISFYNPLNPGIMARNDMPLIK